MCTTVGGVSELIPDETYGIRVRPDESEAVSGADAEFLKRGPSTASVPGRRTRSGSRRTLRKKVASTDSRRYTLK